MTVGRQTIWGCGLTLALAAGGTARALQTQAVPAAQTTTPPNAPAPQNVPDAPAPQTLPQLNTITPVQTALPAAPAPAPDAATQANGGIVPGNSLPSSPTAPAPQDEGPPPEIPGPGQASGMLKSLGTVNVRFIELPFTVKDSKGKLVPGLRWQDVRVYEDGVKQDVRFWSVDPLPLSVALVIDQSVTYDTMEKINTSLSALQGAFTASDEVAVFTYNNGVQKQTDFTGAQSPRLGVVLDRSKGAGRDPLMGLTGPLSQTTIVNNQQVDPNTSAQRNQLGLQLNVPKEYHTLNDAILAAAQATASVDRGRRRIVYVISDGKEYGSKATQKEVIRYLQRNNVTVFATLVGDSSIPGIGFLDRIHIPLSMRDDVLPKYTTATGGGFDPEFRPKGIEESFQRLADEVRAQYMVGYYTHQPLLADTFHKTEIRILRPGLTIIAPDGYYPSAFRTPPARTPTPTAGPAAPPAAAPSSAPPSNP
jgi:VWFA-related protein